jgi:putative ATP-binding cassette transporter
MELFNLIRLNARIDLRTVVALSGLAAISTTLVLMTANAAAGQVSAGQPAIRLLAVMALATLAFSWSQTKANTLAAGEVERLLHGLRLRLFASVRGTTPEALERIGQGSVQAALTSEMQGISNTLPIILIGLQQLVMLVFISLYMAYLSTLAFAMILVFSLVAVFVHLNRMRAVQEANRLAIDDEVDLFGSLTNLLRGFKEARLNEARRYGLLADFEALSARSSGAKSQVKIQWAREFALIQLAFYLMIGLMAFVVPMFTTSFHEEAMKATAAVLFMIGPISTVIQALPAIGEANGSLRHIQQMEEQLQAGLAAEYDAASSVELADQVTEIALEGVHYAYPAADGEAGFRVGPLDAVFRRGEICFITGGNGSGKSTLIDLLTGLRPIDSGTVRVNGRPVAPANLQTYRDRFATVLSGYHLFRVLYGIDDIEPAEADSLLADMDMTGKVRIEDGAFSNVELSQGQRKRLALVSAQLEHKPILVLDEWAADQDPFFRAEFYEHLLPHLKAQGKIIICVTHDDRWFSLADHLYHMREGRFETLR